MKPSAAGMAGRSAAAASSHRGVALGVLHHLRKVLGRGDEFLRDSKLARLDCTTWGRSGLRAPFKPPSGEHGSR